MSGLLRRLRRRRPATADENRSLTPESSEPAGAPAETPAETGGDRPVPGSDDQSTQVLPATAEHEAVAPAEPSESRPVRDLPAGVDPGELATAPAASANRGKLRRRVRYLHRVRELLLRDLGGFMFEIERSAGGTVQERHRRLMEAKTRRIAAVDAELRALEGRLDEPHEQTVLREPGIGGLCPECGDLHASDAHYCARCGAPLDSKARARRDAAVAAAAKPEPKREAAPASASMLWAGGPRPSGRQPAGEEKSDPSEATSQWLALSHHGPATHPAPKDEAAVGHDKPVPAGTPAVGDDAPVVADDKPAPADAPVVADDKPLAGDHEAATADEPAPETPKRSPTPKIEDAPSENGRRDEDVPPPAPDPLASRPEQGS